MLVRGNDWFADHALRPPFDIAETDENIWYHRSWMIEQQRGLLREIQVGSARSKMLAHEMGCHVSRLGLTVAGWLER